MGSPSLNYAFYAFAVQAHSGPGQDLPLQRRGAMVPPARKAMIQLHFIRSLSMSISQIEWKTSNFIFLFDNIDHCRYNEQEPLIEEGSTS